MFSLIRPALRITARQAAHLKRQRDDGEQSVFSHLDYIFEIFVDGFHQALYANNDDDYADMVKKINDTYEDHFKGFVYEGVGAGITVKDLVMPKKVARVASFIKTHAEEHDFIISVGVGIALAKAPWGTHVCYSYLKKLDPKISWAAIDGMAFFFANTNRKKYLNPTSKHPRFLHSSLYPIFDSGLGRSLWWLTTANPDSLQKIISEFPLERQKAMWSGVGTAAAYAGGISSDTLALLKNSIDEQCYPDFQFGSVYASVLRWRGGEESKWTPECVKQVTGYNSEDLAEKTYNQIFVNSDYDYEGTTLKEHGLHLQKIKKEIVQEYFLDSQLLEYDQAYLAN